MKRDMKTTKAGSKRDNRWASRAVQAAFVLRRSRRLVCRHELWAHQRDPAAEPVAVYYELTDVLVSGEFIEDLRVDAHRALVAFSISSTLGITLGFLISRSQYSSACSSPCSPASIRYR